MTTLGTHEILGLFGTASDNRVAVWGGISPDRTRVLLLTWQHEVNLGGRKAPKGKVRVNLVNADDAATCQSNPGYRERLKHIAAIRGGAEGLALIDEAVDPTARVITVKRRNPDRPWRIVELVQVDDVTVDAIMELSDYWDRHKK